MPPDFTLGGACLCGHVPMLLGMSLEAAGPHCQDLKLTHLRGTCGNDPLCLRTLGTDETTESDSNSTMG